MEYKPAGWRKRGNAAIIDGFIMWAILFPISFVVALVLRAVGGENSATTIIRVVINYAITIFIMGWFYKNKGATPGKIYMKLKVIKSDTGKNMGYMDTFVREIIGKALSTILLFIGYFMPLFRDDKKALHDLIAKTQVLYIGPD